MKEENKALCQEVMEMFQVKEFSSASIYESDSRTKFYTGLPANGVFTALVTYLQPKAENLREWRDENETAPSSPNLAEGLSGTFLLRTNCLPCLSAGGSICTARISHTAWAFRRECSPSCSQPG